MNIITKKRGRIAISWLVCITMVFASFAGPFSQTEAQAAVAPPITVDKEVVNTEWVDKDLGIAKVKLTVNSQDIETTVTTPLVTRIVMVLDYSGSMDDEGKIDELKQKAKAFVDQMLALQGDIQIAVVTFSSTAVSNPFSSNATTLKNKIQNTYTGVATNIQDGIRKGQALLNTVVADNEIMVVLSDGEPNRSYKGTAGGPFTPADTALNYDGATWPTVITAFDYSHLLNANYNYNLPNNGSDKDYQIGSAWITNHGFGTVSEALLAKKAGTTIYSVGFDMGATSNAAKVMKSVASSNSKFFMASDDLTVAFETIGTSIIEQAAGEGAVVTDPMGFNTDVAGGNNYQFKALIDGSHPVVHTEPSGMTSSVTYDSPTDTFNWVLTTGDIKEGTYTLTYYVQIQDLNGNGVGDNVDDVLTNDQAVLSYTDAAGSPQSIPFEDPTLQVEHYNVEYYFNGTIDPSLTTTQAAIAGRTPITVVAPAFAGFDFDETVYGNNAANTALEIVQDGANNVIKIYYVDKTGSLEITKEVLKNNAPFDVTDTFYFGLFADAAGADLIGDVKSIGIVDDNSGTVEFTGLTLGTTYYAFETDAAGAPIADTLGGFIHLGNYVLDGQGAEFTPNVEDLSGEITIKNQIAVGTSVEFVGTKNLTGRYLGANDVFHFAIFEGDNATPFAAGQTVAVLGSASNEVAIEFDTIEYGINDLGTHHYVVKEIPPIDGILNGILFDTLPRTVTVEVTMDAQGILSATVTYPDRAEELVFNNEYEPASTTWTPDVTKELTGKDLTNGMFEFTITEDDSTEPIQTVANVGTSVPFSAIEFTEAGTYYFEISEVIPAEANAEGVLDGIAYDGHTVYAVVTVTDNGLGELEASAEYDGDTEFVNEYSTDPVTWIPDVTKVLTGKELTDEMFSFTIQEANRNVRTALYSEMVMNNGSSIPFTGIEFYGPGTYYFEITEEIGSIPGITYDTTVIYVTVVVTDNGDGTLEAEATYEGGQEFNNSYEGPGSIEVTKKVLVLTDDSTVTVNYTFHAALFENNDGTLTRVSDLIDLNVVESASVDVTFGNLDLDKTYFVFETDAAGNIIQPESDGTIITPILPDWTKVLYEGNMITLTPDNMKGATVITNVFDPEDLPLLGSITVNKTVTVDGKAFASNRTFYVALFEDKGLTKIVSEVKALKMNGNSATTTEFLTDIDGNPLVAGTTYFVAETDINGVPLTGSAEVVGFEIQIDNAEATITEEGTTVNIINKFKSEEFPLTGDNSNMGLWLFLAMLSVAGAIAPFAFRKKEVTND